MALGSTWFDGSAATSYTDVRKDPDFSSATASTTTNGSYIRYAYGPCNWLCFKPGKYNEDTGENDKDYELGWVIAKRDSDDQVKAIRNVTHTLRNGPAISSGTGNNLYRPFDNGGTSPGDADLFCYTSTGGSDTCSVYIYQPYCWYGRTCQVIASVLLTRSLDDSYIDQTAFSASDDAQAAMGTTDADEPFVFYRRELGRSIGEVVKDLALNSWDLLCIGMSGKVAMMPRSSVPAGYTISGLAKTDGVVSVSWRYAWDLLVNHTWACEGRYYDLTFEDLPSSFSTVVSSCSEVGYPTAVYEQSTSPYEEFEDATSQTKYGVQELGSRAKIDQKQNPMPSGHGGMRQVSLIEQNGSEREVIYVDRYHLPYLCNVENSGADPLDAKETLMARLENVESQLRRELTVVQDLRGLDYDVGYLLEDVAVTGDGDTIDDAFCIKKTLDFNDLSVTSVLLEEPS